MQTTRFYRLLILAAMLGGIRAAPAQADTYLGRIIRVADGDSLTLLDTQNRQHNIRLIGIDAPELAQVGGQQAQTSLAALALDQKATALCYPPVLNQREICTVTIGGQDIGLAQIRSGLAWWYLQNAAALSVATQSNYRQAEFHAKTRRLGLWNAKNPKPPWDWRPERLDQ